MFIRWLTFYADFAQGAGRWLDTTIPVNRILIFFFHKYSFLTYFSWRSLSDKVLNGASVGKYYELWMSCLLSRKRGQNCFKMITLFKDVFLFMITTVRRHISLLDLASTYLGLYSAHMCNTTYFIISFISFQNVFPPLLFRCAPLRN